LLPDENKLETFFLLVSVGGAASRACASNDRAGWTGNKSFIFSMEIYFVVYSEVSAFLLGTEVIILPCLLTSRASRATDSFVRDVETRRRRWMPV
jgi:hypothetical protein